MVNLPTWLWADPSNTQSRAIQIGVTRFRVQVRAVATSTLWEFGDGSPALRCAEPTRPYVDGQAGSSACTHVFRRSSAGQPGQIYRARATTIWQVRWSASDGTGGTLATVRRVRQFTVPVQEVQTVVTRSR